MVIWLTDQWRLKRFRIISDNPRDLPMPKWAHWLEVFGWFVLVVGIGLELWGHVRVEEITTRENQRLNAELGKTVEHAAEAHLRAAKAEQLTEQLKKENAKLYARIQPRRITAEQKENLIAIMGTGPKSGPIDLDYPVSDGEAGIYASQIKDILAACRFELRDSGGRVRFGRIPSVGLFVAVQDPQFPPQRAILIFRAFSEVGLQIATVPLSNLGHDDVRIVVGAKPFSP